MPPAAHHCTRAFNNNHMKITKHILQIADAIDAINRILALGLRWLTVAMVLIQFGIVIGRYVFGVNSIWVQESILYLHATLFMLAAGYAL